MKTLANHIEYELQHGFWSHCAVYEDELQRLWPSNAPYREIRIASFAAKHGFRLRFYYKGMCAIFDRQPDNDAKLIRNRCDNFVSRRVD
jgi:hypothetical protein